MVDINKNMRIDNQKNTSRVVFTSYGVWREDKCGILGIWNVLLLKLMAKYMHDHLFYNKYYKRKKYKVM